MTNKEIIKELAISQGIFSPDQIAEIEESGEEIPLHTESVWKQKGYSIKEGETGIETRLWKKMEREDKFYKSKVYLFRIDQVQPIT